MQEIFILRHGLAEDLNESKTKTDFDRKLTEEGKEKIKKLSLFMGKLEEGVDLVLSSPYLRTKETAEIFIHNLIPKPKLIFVDFLASGVSPKEIAKGLLDYSSSKKIVLVGHAPDLETFLGNLIGATRIKLKKGAIAKVTLNNELELLGELEWLVIPKLLKKFKLKE